MESESTAAEGGFIISYPLWVPGFAPADGGAGIEVSIIDNPELGDVVCVFMSKPEGERYLAANGTAERPGERLTQFQTVWEFLDWVRGLPQTVRYLAFPTLDDQGAVDSAAFVHIADYVHDLETGSVTEWEPE